MIFEKSAKTLKRCKALNLKRTKFLGNKRKNVIFYGKQSRTPGIFDQLLQLLCIVDRKKSIFFLKENMKK